MCSNAGVWGQYNSHDLVFQGTVISDAGWLQITPKTPVFVFDVAEVYKGEVGKRIKIKYKAGWHNALVSGETYIMFANKNGDTGRCTIPESLKQGMSGEVERFILYHRDRKAEESAAPENIYQARVEAVDGFIKEFRRPWTSAHQYKMALHFFHKDYPAAQSSVDDYRRAFSNRKSHKIQGYGDRLFYDVSWDPAVEETQGRIYYETGRMEEALAHFTALVNQEPGSRSTLFRAWRVVLLIKTGRVQEVPADNFHAQFSGVEPEEILAMAEDMVSRYSELKDIYPLRQEIRAFSR